jgi:Ca2+-transporting ATPase
MQRHPRDAKVGIFTRPVVMLMMIGGAWSTLVNVGLFWWSTHSGRSLEQAMSMTFVSLVLIQFFKAYNYRSDRLSVLHRPFANKWLNLAVGWELVLIVLILYVPFLQKLFGTFPLSPLDWAIIGGAALTIVPVLELAKWLERKGLFGKLD